MTQSAMTEDAQSAILTAGRPYPPGGVTSAFHGSTDVRTGVLGATLTGVDSSYNGGRMLKPPLARTTLSLGGGDTRVRYIG